MGTGTTPGTKLKRTLFSAFHHYKYLNTASTEKRLVPSAIATDKTVLTEFSGKYLGGHAGACAYVREAKSGKKKMGIDCGR